MNESNAYHQAGHIVALYSFGGAVLNCCAFRPEKKTLDEEIFTWKAEAPLPKSDCIVILYAGGFAQRRFLAADPADWEEDFQRAREMAAEFNLDADALLNRAEHFVFDRWKEIDALGYCLWRSLTLDHFEIQIVMNAALEGEDSIEKLKAEWELGWTNPEIERIRLQWIPYRQLRGLSESGE